MQNSPRDSRGPLALGGDRGTRTPDLYSAIVALSQLSYVPARRMGLYGYEMQLVNASGGELTESGVHAMNERCRAGLERPEWDMATGACLCAS